MTSLTLWFSGEAQPQLQKTLFAHPLLAQPKTCVRGKTSGPHSGAGTFQWTAAVKALAIFFLRAKLRPPGEQAVLLEGEQGSVAASLDFAIGKMPTWLMDMFSIDSSGISLLHRLVSRTNPELKRPGPVAVGLGAQALSAAQINLYWNGSALKERAGMQRLLESIENQVCGLRSSKLLRESSGELPYNGSWHELLRQLLQNEVRSLLGASDIFRRQALQENMHKLSANPRLQKLGLTSSSLDLELDSRLSSSARLGVTDEPQQLDRFLDTEERLQAALSVSQIGALSLLAYLRFVKGYSIDITLRYPHSLQLAEVLAQGDASVAIDMCALAIGPATKILASRCADFYPLMFMPRQSYRVVAPLAARRKRNAAAPPYAGEFFLVNDPYSDALLYLDALQAGGAMDRSKIELTHMEPDEAVHAMAYGEADMRSIVGFPYYALSAMNGKSVILDEANPDVCLRDSLLFVRKELLAQRGKVIALDIALRDAWLTLKNDPQALSCVIDHILADTEYAGLVRRFGGMDSCL